MTPTPDLRHEYWTEAAECAMTDAGVSFTQEQLALVAEALVGAAENESMMYAPTENPLRYENAQLQRELKRERDRYPCPRCKGEPGEVVFWESGPGGSRHVGRCELCLGRGDVPR